MFLMEPTNNLISMGTAQLLSCKISVVKDIQRPLILLTEVSDRRLALHNILSGNILFYLLLLYFILFLFVMI